MEAIGAEGVPAGSGLPKHGEELILGYRLLQATPSDHTGDSQGALRITQIRC